MKSLRVLLLLALCWLCMPAVASAQATNSPYQFLNLTSFPQVDLYLDGNIVFAAVESTIFSSERVLTQPGAYTFAIYEASADRTTTDPLAEATIELTGGEQFLLIAYESAGAPALLPLLRDLEPVGANLSRIQAANLSDVPALTITGQNADVLTENLPAGELVKLDVSAGNYQVILTDESGAEVGAAGINAQPGLLTVFIMYANARTIQFTQPLAQKAMFRFVHGGRISPALDVYLNDALVFENVAFQQATDYALVDADTYTIALYETGTTPTSSTPLWSGSVTLSTSLPQTGVAMGETNFRMLTYADDLQQLPIDTVRMRVINAALNIPLMTIYDSTNNVLIGGLEYALGSQNLAQPVGETAYLFKETDGVFEIPLEGFTLEPHTSYTFIVVGNALNEDGVSVLPLAWRWDEE